MSNSKETSDYVLNKRYELDVVYLLRSAIPKYKNSAYIGTTPNPQKRLRMHNGELAAGAKKTESKRPWEFVLLVYGFPSDNKIETKLRVLGDLLFSKSYCRWPLHLHVMISLDELDKISNKSSILKLSNLPKNFRITQGSFDTYLSETGNMYSFADINGIPKANLFLAQEKSEKNYLPNDEPLLPISGKCPDCEQTFRWGDLIDTMHLRRTLLE
ncbi:3600_t:CDS:2 [Diversispora eburnea]|uniref:3600_t:CDS:1 n=1 Tax=Diversispora eburnea TaxID=1213867 RepID=A0A9N9FJS8_9GLOM|nr:3600_t:CDS:2 [Diversispora eburnea]